MNPVVELGVDSYPVSVDLSILVVVTGVGGWKEAVT